MGICNSSGQSRDPEKINFHYESLHKNLRGHWDNAMEFKDEDWKFYSVLGMGAFGKVVEVWNIKKEQFYALKIVDIKAICEKYGETTACRVNVERDLLDKLDHPFLTKLEGYYSYQDRYVIFVLELSHYGSLNDVMEKHQACYPVDIVRIYAAELIDYRDLRHDNILVHHDHHLRVTDVGYAAVIFREDKTGPIHKLTSARMSEPEVGHGNLMTKVGARGWKAPEMIQFTGYDYSIDYWGVGLVLFWLLSGGQMAYQNTNKFALTVDLDKTTIEAEIVWPRDIDPVVKDLISKLLDKDPTTRLGATIYANNDRKSQDAFRFAGDATEIKAHPFFTDIDWKNLRFLELNFGTVSSKIRKNSVLPSAYETLYQVINDIDSHDIVNVLNNWALM